MKQIIDANMFMTDMMAIHCLQQKMVSTYHIEFNNDLYDDLNFLQDLWFFKLKEIYIDKCGDGFVYHYRSAIAFKGTIGSTPFLYKKEIHPYSESNTYRVGSYMGIFFGKSSINEEKIMNAWPRYWTWANLGHSTHPCILTEEIVNSPDILLASEHAVVREFGLKLIEGRKYQK